MRKILSILLITITGVVTWAAPHSRWKADEKNRVCIDTTLDKTSSVESVEYKFKSQDGGCSRVVGGNFLVLTCYAYGKKIETNYFPEESLCELWLK